MFLALFVPQLLSAADISSELCKKWQFNSAGNDKGVFSSSPLVRYILAVLDNNFLFVLASYILGLDEN